MNIQDKIDYLYSPYKFLVKSVCVTVLGDSPTIELGKHFENSFQIEKEAVRVALEKGFSPKKTEMFLKHCLTFAPKFCSVVVVCGDTFFVVSEGLVMPD